MAMQAVHKLSNQSVRTDGATMGERVTEKLDRLTYALADIEDTVEHWETLYGYVPADVRESYDSAIESLAQYADYWGFDC